MKPSRSKVLAVSVVAISIATWVAAQEAQPEAELESPAYRIQRLTSEIKIDGVLDEPAWAQATVIDRFWEWFPGRNLAAPVDTEIRLAYDDDNLYLGAHARDPKPSSIRAHYMDRDDVDSLVQDDYIILMIDSFSDHRRAFQFRVNPLGIQADALNGYVGGSEDWSWDLIWASAGRLVEDGYIIEIAIPFSQLPFPAGDGEQTWLINVGRSYPRDQRHRMASYETNYNSGCGTCDFNEVSGFQGMRKGRSLELTPTLTAGRSDRRTDLPASELVEGDEDYDPGFSGSWGITPSSRLGFAVNPDFSQVEADTAQLAVNERFALFFPEQRPFFLEGVDLFQTPLNAVFTRTVVDPDVGVKLTGKQGRNALGVFASQDTVNNVILPSNQGSAFASSRDGLLDDQVQGTVLRYRRDLGSSSALGVLYAGREGDAYHNRVAGIDGSIQLKQSDTITFQALHADTAYPDPLVDALGLDDQEVSGDAYIVNYSHFSREWFWSANARRFDRDFRADSGFIPRVDLERFAGNLQRTFWLEDSFLTSAAVGVNLSTADDTDGLLTDRKIGVSGNFRGPRQSTLFVQTWNIDQRSPQGSLFEDLRGAEFFFEIQPGSAIKLSWYTSYEDAVDFTNNKRADLLQLNPAMQLKLGRHVNANFSHFRRSFEEGGDTYLQADLTELRVFYHFNTRAFVRAIVQRTQQQNEPLRFDIPVEGEIEDLFSQLLFSYKLNAQTVLFAGYSDSRQAGDAFDRIQTGRTFFVKLGYAFLL